MGFLRSLAAAAAAAARLSVEAELDLRSGNKCIWRGEALAGLLMVLRG